MKTSIVNHVEFKKEFDGKYGTSYVFYIEMQNGDKGEYTSKSRDQKKFIVGQEAKYETETISNEYGTFQKIKPIQENSFGGGVRGRSPEERLEIIRQSCLERAILWVTAKNKAAETDTPTLLNISEQFVRYAQTGFIPKTKEIKETEATVAVKEDDIFIKLAFLENKDDWRNVDNFLIKECKAQKIKKGKSDIYIVGAEFKGKLPTMADFYEFVTDKNSQVIPLEDVPTVDVDDLPF